MIRDDIRSYLSYYSTIECDEPDFDTREDNKYLYQYGMCYATEEEYNNFIKQEKILEKLVYGDQSKDKIFIKK